MHNFKERLNRVSPKPKTLFLIDGLGGLVTALLLYGVLRPFHEYVGMPPKVLIYLTLIAALFFIYSTLCHLFVKENWKPFLKIISYANLLYCCLTLLLMIYYFQELTTLGVGYFLAEILVILVLVYFERKAIRF
jgi:hypothetical protein